MFDANAAHINCGERFFAEVHATDAQLEAMGVNCGDILICVHKEKSGGRMRINESSLIYTSINSEPKEWRYDSKSEDWSWMVYSGRPSGNGFISDKWKDKALEFLGGSWDK